MTAAAPEIFRPQVFAALELFTQGAFDPVNTQGAWAGEIGMVQMLPKDIVDHAIDGDGDGRVDLLTLARRCADVGGEHPVLAGLAPARALADRGHDPRRSGLVRDRHPQLSARVGLGTRRGAGAGRAATCRCRMRRPRSSCPRGGTARPSSPIRISTCSSSGTRVSPMS